VGGRELFSQLLPGWRKLQRSAIMANKRLEGLSKAREKLAANPLPPMTPEEIEAEIDAYRAEVRRAAGT